MYNQSRDHSLINVTKMMGSFISASTTTKFKVNYENTDKIDIIKVKIIIKL